MAARFSTRYPPSCGQQVMSAGFSVLQSSQKMFLLRLWVLLVAFGLASIKMANSHNESGEWSCDVDTDSLVLAEFKPGIVTLDGHADDWKDIEGFEFSLLPALDPDEDKAYKDGKMAVKAVHDGKDVFFLLQVGGDYVYSKGNDNKCPSIAMMFQVGEKASYHNMGGCKESRDTCNNKSCKGYEVDIIHFSIGSAIPGRVYDGSLTGSGNRNGDNTGVGNLVDLFAWNPHCRYLDGFNASVVNSSSMQNEWRGVWWHDSFTKNSGYVEEDSPFASSGQKGMYYFEFSRPLRTLDHLQQDVQFTIGQLSKFSVAFWYPVDGKSWHPSGHYSIGCDWVPLEITSARSVFRSRASGNAIGILAFILSFAAFCISVSTGYWVFKIRSTTFQPIGHP